MENRIVRLISALCLATLCSACSCLEYAPPAKSAFYSDIDKPNYSRGFKPLGTLFILNKSTPTKEYTAITLSRKGGIYKATAPLFSGDDGIPMNMSLSASRHGAMAGIEVTFRF